MFILGPPQINLLFYYLMLGSNNGKKVVNFHRLKVKNADIATLWPAYPTLLCNKLDNFVIEDRAAENYLLLETQENVAANSF